MSEQPNPFLLYGQWAHMLDAMKGAVVMTTFLCNPCETVDQVAIAAIDEQLDRLMKKLKAHYGRVLGNRHDTADITVADARYLAIGLFRDLIEEMDRI